MGLVVSRFRAGDALALLPELRARTEALLGSRVALALQPAHTHFTALGLNVVVSEHEHAFDVRISGKSWLAGADKQATLVREAFISRGGHEARGLRSTTYRFSGELPSLDEIASSLGGRMVHRYPVWAVLRSGLRTPVEVQLYPWGFDLEAPIVIFGKLFESAVKAAQGLAVPMSLGQAPD